jgi:hypothetical protein
MLSSPVATHHPPAFDTQLFIASARNKNCISVRKEQFLFTWYLWYDRKLDLLVIIGFGDSFQLFIEIKHL